MRREVDEEEKGVGAWEDSSMQRRRPVRCRRGVSGSMSMKR